MVERLGKFNTDKKGVQLYKPSTTYNGSWGSQLNATKDDFMGTDSFEGVNPANGMVIYYQLPKLKDTLIITLEIHNQNGELIRSYSSKKDETYLSYEGAPNMEQVLPKKEGLNRVVWDLKYETMIGVPDVYIESDFSGHKTPPGSYTITLLVDSQKVTTTGVINQMPYYDVSDKQYQAYDVFMNDAERNLNDMHTKINSLFKVQSQLLAILDGLKSGTLKEEGQKLLADLQKWDNDMIQRKSKAYDDVENFPNMFTAEYLFLINQSTNDMGRLNQSSLDRKKELDQQWEELNKTANLLLNNQVPAFNTMLWNSGIGALRIIN